MKIKSNFYYLTLAVFLLISVEVFSQCDSKVKYFLYFDFRSTTGCGYTLLQYYSSSFENLGLKDNFCFITNTIQKKEFQLFVKKNKDKTIINDTSGIYSKFIENKTLPVIFVTNSEDRILFSQDNIKINFINLKDLTNNFKCVNIDKYESYKILDTTVDLVRPVPPLINNQKDKFVVLDKFDLSIKEFNINTGKPARKIEVDSALAYFFVKDSIDAYKKVYCFSGKWTKGIKK